MNNRASGGVSEREQALVVAHHHPGRLRVRARPLEDDSELRSRAVEALRTAPGVISAESTATGSVLVEYDPERVDAGALLTGIAAATKLAVAPPPSPASTARTVAEAGRALDAHVAEWSGGKFDLRVAVPAVLAAGSFASFLLSTHRRSPRWDNLLYWSFTLFRTLNDERLNGGRTTTDNGDARHGNGGVR